MKKSKKEITGRSYNFGRKLDGTIATEEDWNKWKEEFWTEEAKRLLDDSNDVLFDKKLNKD